MSIISVTVTGNPQSIPASVAAIIAQVPQIASLAAVEVWQNHLDANYIGKPNKLGGSSTGYWGRVRGSIKGSFTGSTATITASGAGLLMKLLGGTVTPGKGTSSKTGKPTKMLAIPVHPSAHGKRPGDFGKGLFLVQLHGPGSAAGLVQKQGKSKKRGTILFVLAKSAKIKPDPNILPPTDAIAANMQTRVTQFVQSMGSP